MSRYFVVLFAVACNCCVPTYALTGSGESAVGALDTVPPTLDAISASSDGSMVVTFSEDMLAPGIQTPANYVVSDPGAGTLAPRPDSISGSGPYNLLWTNGEMLDGETVTLTVTGVQDAVGNPIDPGAHVASTTGAGVPPVFSGLTITPPEAAPGETVTIYFAASEDLDTAPDVTVNGNPATLEGGAKATGFSYTYTVAELDPLGPATVFISGFDAAGNLGTLSGSFTIAEAVTLPMNPWPAIFAFMLTGLAVLLRRRGTIAWLALFLLVAPTALAQTPTVSNVAFTQQATTTGTEVVITYDLDAPHVLANIIVSLSKDGGNDGFPFPVTSVAGDLNIVPSGTGHTITWDIAADYPNEEIPNAQLRVTATDTVELPEMISVAAGSFAMGNSGAGDDATYSQANELPVHTVMLSAYEIGKFEVTNQQVCDVYNWAATQGYITTLDSTTATAFGQELLNLDSSASHIEYLGGVFQPETRTGLPTGTVYSMADYPAQAITWFGAVAYCNWLSEMAGLTPVYDTSTWEADFAHNGYHPPTEAQWERAAAWDGAKHWIYGFLSDTLTGNDRANYTSTNPMGLTSNPKSSPVGWFNGVNVSPNGSVATVDSPSPVGAYDMCGNMLEWCHDWMNSGYYAVSPGIDPTGPTSGGSRALRGGPWIHAAQYCRSAFRNANPPATPSFLFGFRLARNTSYSLSYTAGSEGSVTGNTSQAVLPGASGTPVEAVPGTGYTFLDWSDGVTDNPRTDSNVAGGIDVTANFAVALVSVPASSFDMGNSGVGDDATYSYSEELPLHTVTLSAYEIGKFEVTNQQVCDTFNWANAQGYFTTVNATTVTAFGRSLLNIATGNCHIEYVDGTFQPEKRTGLPGTTEYSMADHPVQSIPWYGAAAFCNWRSEIEGLTPVYDTSTWEANFANDGYHLPTEAQWERAAAWDGTKHWIYGFTSDSAGSDRANYNVPAQVNPLGLSAAPLTSPVGWFDGANVSPNGDIATVNSVSPVGAYDMSGNVWEWCNDWYDSGYYATTPAEGPDPEGPSAGTTRAIRGGAWSYRDRNCRSASRHGDLPAGTFNITGFRVAR